VIIYYKSKRIIDMESKYLSDDEGLAFMAYLFGPPQRIQSIEEFRHGMYVMKVIGSCWFERTLPRNLKEEFVFYVNEDWPTEEPPKGIKEIVDLPEESLEWLTPRLKRPEWIRNNTPRVKLSLSQFINGYEGLVRKFNPKNFG
jgi:uncharacterized protein (DUF3820 family)